MSTFKKISELDINNSMLADDQIPIYDNANAETRSIKLPSVTMTMTNKTLTSPTITTPTGIVKGDVGLGNVDNTSDSTKLTATLLAVYPVGAIYISVVNTSPATLFGGTWAVFGEGYALVGYKNGDADFGTVETTVGAKTVTLDATMIPAHTHGSKSLTGGWSYHGDEGGSPMRSPSGIVSGTYLANAYRTPGTAAAGASSYSQPTINATHEHTSVGGGLSHSNIQPSIPVYMWKRTA